MPDRGGDLRELWPLLNIAEDATPLVEAWLVATAIGSFPVPILLLGGAQGAGKSTAAWMLAQLIDPSACPLRNPPREPEMLALTASGSRVLVLDNLSSLGEAMSDGCCRLVSGEGLVRRRLFTDDALSVISLRRSLIFTTIDLSALRGDLGERIIAIELNRIDPAARRTEAEIQREFHRLRPRLLGALLDRVCVALGLMNEINISELPRMADFARIVAALDVGANRGALETYRRQSAAINESVVEADAIAQGIVAFAAALGEPWQGTAGELLDQLKPNPLPKGWPTTPRGMAAAVKRAAPSLAAVGVIVELPKDHSREAGRARRIYTIVRRAEP